MLCERFHKTLKHDIMEGKANVRIDSLMHLLITLTVEKEEEREIMVARGVEEGRYRLQQHHKSHKSAVEKYAHQQHHIVVAGNGLWTVEDNGKTYHVKEQYCPCDKKDFAAGRMDTLSLLNKPDEELLATLEKAEKLQNEFRKLMAEAATRINGKENDVRLARRPDVASNGRPQALTPIRKLHKRSHLRSVQQAKRKLSFEIPDCAAGERDTCAVCLRMQPSNMGSETTISWIECP
ncbi:unnamed protein product, partial [Cylicostephanus goldi]